MLRDNYSHRDKLEDNLRHRAFICKVCKERIFEGARKCTHCRSFQDWRRHISMGETSIAFLLTLTSVISIVSSIITFVRISSSYQIYATLNDLGGAIEGKTQKTLAYYIWKEGKEPAGINKILLTYQIQKNKLVEVDLYADKYSKLGLLSDETTGEIFLRVVKPEMLDFKQLKATLASELVCQIKMNSLGIKGEKREFLSENIESNLCLEFLKSYE